VRRAVQVQVPSSADKVAIVLAVVVHTLKPDSMVV
jgi:hypothetical protein